jgi:tRNA(fMet)-specific endonuclease VapC
MQASAEEQFYTTIITVEEQMRGWLALIAKARKLEREVAAYARLLGLIEYFRDRPILPYDDAASAHFGDLKSRKLRVGTLDLKIAAIALANHALLVTRNRVDFDHIPGLRVEDWTKAL